MPVPHAPKPEPIRLNMDGIAPEPVTFGGTEQNFQYDWQKLVELPPFQMFAAEKAKASIDNLEDWIINFVLEKLYEIGEIKFFQEYSTWHKAKGHWKNENEFGEVI